MLTRSYFCNLQRLRDIRVRPSVHIVQENYLTLCFTQCREGRLKSIGQFRSRRIYKG